MEYIMPNETNESTIFPAIDSLQYNTSVQSKKLLTIADFIADCRENKPTVLYPPMQIVALILALPANAILLWLLVKNRKTLSPSEVLGLNFAVLGVLFCLNLPQDINITVTGKRSGLPLRITNAFASISYFGCPLLLTSMSLERYVAVAHPVLFMRLGKWEYRAACSAIIWLLNCMMAVMGFVYSIASMALMISIIINLMFLIIVFCLIGIVGVLCKKGPGEGDQNNSTAKKQALKNVITILVPSTIIYLPILGLAPFLLIVQMQKKTNDLVCNFLILFSVFPNFGVCIGPMFYMARLRRQFCVRKNESRETTTDQRK